MGVCEICQRNKDPHDEQACQCQDLEEKDFYSNEEGFLVFTRSYHLKRGYCCENGCKHCPYKAGSKEPR